MGSTNRFNAQMTAMIQQFAQAGVHDLFNLIREGHTLFQEIQSSPQAKKVSKQGLEDLTSAIRNAQVRLEVTQILYIQQLLIHVTIEHLQDPDQIELFTTLQNSLDTISKINITAQVQKFITNNKLEGARRNFLRGYYIHQKGDRHSLIHNLQSSPDLVHRCLEVAVRELLHPKVKKGNVTLVSEVVRRSQEVYIRNIKELKKIIEEILNNGFTLNPNITELAIFFQNVTDIPQNSINAEALQSAVALLMSLPKVEDISSSYGLNEQTFRKIYADHEELFIKSRKQIDQEQWDTDQVEGFFTSHPLPNGIILKQNAVLAPDNEALTLILSQAFAQLGELEDFSGNIMPISGIVMPINFFDAHWAGIFIHTLSNGQVQVIFDDPLGTQIPKTLHHIITTVAQHHQLNVVISDFASPETLGYHPAIQTLGTNDCGPLTVYTLWQIAQHHNQLEQETKAVIDAIMQAPHFVEEMHAAQGVQLYALADTESQAPHSPGEIIRYTLENSQNIRQLQKARTEAEQTEYRTQHLSEFIRLESITMDESRERTAIEADRSADMIRIASEEINDCLLVQRLSRLSIEETTLTLPPPGASIHAFEQIAVMVTPLATNVPQTLQQTETNSPPAIPPLTSPSEVGVPSSSLPPVVEAFSSAPQAPAVISGQIITTDAPPNVPVSSSSDYPVLPLGSTMPPPSPHGDDS